MNEKYVTYNLYFSNLIFHIFDTQSSVNDILNFIKLHIDKDELSIEGVLNRLLFHKTYGFVEHISFRSKKDAKRINRILYNNDRFLSYDDWFDINCFIDKETIKNNFNLTDEEIEKKIKNSKWNEFFNKED